ncbi:MAG TPA: hypothetical protein VET88_06555 [Gammaproteobacteria bacterium]|nr:hypothetical protein [Gammaproteobacteria bacterium]
MKKCIYCGNAGRPRWQPAWLAVVAVLVWLLPLGFLSHGFWPFFLLPSLAISAWAVTTVRRVCPACGRPWQPADRDAV